MSAQTAGFVLVAIGLTLLLHTGTPLITFGVLMILGPEISAAIRERRKPERAAVRR